MFFYHLKQKLPSLGVLVFRAVCVESVPANMAPMLTYCKNEPKQPMRHQRKLAKNAPTLTLQLLHLPSMR